MAVTTAAQKKQVDAPMKCERPLLVIAHRFRPFFFGTAFRVLLSPRAGLRIG